MSTISGAPCVIVTGRLQRQQWPADRLDSLIKVNFITNTMENYITHVLNKISLGKGGEGIVVWMIIL